MASSDVRNEPPVFARYSRAHDAQLATAFDERRYGLEDPGLLVSQEVRVQTDAKRKSCATRDELGLARHKNSGADIREPQHRTGVHDAERIEDAGLDWHLPDDALCRMLCDREFNCPGYFHDSLTTEFDNYSTIIDPSLSTIEPLVSDMTGWTESSIFRKEPSGSTTVIERRGCARRLRTHKALNGFNETP
jgi:hypothetical protein